MAKRKAVSNKEMTPLAWAGWETRIPKSWAPLHLEGDHEKGRVMIGGSEKACFQIRWGRQGRGETDARRWISQHVKAISTESAIEPLDVDPDFNASAWLPAVSRLDKSAKGIWFGFSAKARLGLEFDVNLSIEPEEADLIKNRIIPGLKTTGTDEPHRWAVFDVSFVTPPGYTLRDRHMYSGDMAFRFVRGMKSTLVLRQVYPADVSLQRRNMGLWLRKFPFKEHRKYRTVEKSRDWSVSVGARTLKGKRRLGRKVFAFPLTWVRARHSTAGAVIDPDLNRMLIAEYDSPSETDHAVISKAIRDMNWARGPQDDKVRAGVKSPNKEHKTEVEVASNEGGTHGDTN